MESTSPNFLFFHIHTAFSHLRPRCLSSKLSHTRKPQSLSSTIKQLIKRGKLIISAWSRRYIPTKLRTLASAQNAITRCWTTTESYSGYKQMKHLKRGKSQHLVVPIQYFGCLNYTRYNRVATRASKGTQHLF